MPEQTPNDTHWSEGHAQVSKWVCVCVRKGRECLCARWAAFTHSGEFPNEYTPFATATKRKHNNNKTLWDWGRLSRPFAIHRRDGEQRRYIALYIGCNFLSVFVRFFLARSTHISDYTRCCAHTKTVLILRAGFDWKINSNQRLYSRRLEPVRYTFGFALWMQSPPLPPLRIRYTFIRIRPHICRMEKR